MPILNVDVTHLDESSDEMSLTDHGDTANVWDEEVMDIPDTQVHHCPQQTIVLSITSVISQGDDYSVL